MAEKPSHVSRVSLSHLVEIGLKLREKNQDGTGKIKSLYRIYS
jgi:hypothetical protein